MHFEQMFVNLNRIQNPGPIAATLIRGSVCWLVGPVASLTQQQSRQLQRVKAIDGAGGSACDTFEYHHYRVKIFPTSLLGDVALLRHGGLIGFFVGQGYIKKALTKFSAVRFAMCSAAPPSRTAVLELLLAAAAPLAVVVSHRGRLACSADPLCGTDDDEVSSIAAASAACWSAAAASRAAFHCCKIKPARGRF